MKKKWVGIISIVTLLTLGACSNGEEQEAAEETTDDQVIRVGSESADADIWRFVANSDAAEKAGLEIEVEDIDGGAMKNNATADGDIDANAFQSIGYLESYNEDSIEKLIPIATTYVEPMGVYSDKYEDIDEVEDNAVVALADNPANTARGLRVLESAGLIELNDDFDDGVGTPEDISKNPKNLEFNLIDDLTGPRVLQDVDMALISNTIALEGGLNVLNDAIYREEADESNRINLNIIAVREDRQDEEELQQLGELYHDPEVQEYIEEEFDGTKVEVDLPISNVWND
ncbi:MetQ/NlpA family ABC transporter substrate-binding protein [Tetragenococcus koreensis]|uniref:MetQ/NlpA family ABC transporter substrate-binding protein n=1 Tax=Tetragenococcus koreensis TaxID=290335 RepID=UPI001F181195|nr:MetQ/NlpA family ABC transporter substrate-binding protein [Tetragenococcus koreensis]MCF1585972.1 MetQ/NlpA family ABC transporter substrate-binding protein [Tetragenococcus koreensis]MCF1615540.1 MetQ/NlpA family ABC transporter substrate-binding protein [Tetragenococcus koreensis]MCF1620596.1 MetQ/NlpA family ABC transporter substrate-binding protein [Tetragenococcus koreensis]MCF1625337.1 MetQ/NlpA family ABC transporter substrate-binding protein [Tetragenococcus koreensis]MCF1627990.1 